MSTHPTASRRMHLCHRRVAQRRRHCIDDLRVDDPTTPVHAASPAVRLGSRRFATIAIAAVLVLCLLCVTLTPYVRLPFAVAACAALLATDYVMSRIGRRSRLGPRGRRGFVALTLLLTLAGIAFIPIPNTRPSLYVVLGASALAAAMYALSADTLRL